MSDENASILDRVPSTHHDLLQKPLSAVLATVDAKGRPQSTAVWYLLGEDGVLRSSVTTNRQKYVNLSGNPACSLFIVDPANPFHTLEIRANAELTPDPEKEMLAKFASFYNVDLAMLDIPGTDRVTVTYKSWHVVVFG